jgi:hypothetical protein
MEKHTTFVCNYPTCSTRLQTHTLVLLILSLFAHYVNRRRLSGAFQRLRSPLKRAWLRSAGYLRSPREASDCSPECPGMNARATQLRPVNGAFDPPV